MGTGNLRTRGHLKHPVPAQTPHRLAHPPVSPSTLRLATTASGGSFLGTARRWSRKPGTPTCLTTEFPRGRVQATGGTGSPPRTLGQSTCPGSPSQSAEHRACGSQAGPRRRPGRAPPPVGPRRVQWKRPTGSAVVVRESWPGLSLGEGPGPLLSALRSSAVPPQQGPEEKLRLREAETGSGSHSCVWSGGEQGPPY